MAEKLVVGRVTSLAGGAVKIATYPTARRSITELEHAVLRAARKWRRNRTEANRASLFRAIAELAD